MKQDPYAGLDQRLFQEAVPPTAKQSTKQRDNEATLPRASETSREATTEPTQVRGNVETAGRTNEDTTVRGLEAPSERRVEATRPRAAPLRGQKPPARIGERHSHDIFHDQVRWMNRIKLDIEERYGRKVTSNAIVQLALDSLREDFDANGARSQLIRVLVKDQLIQTPVAGEVDEEEGE